VSGAVPAGALPSADTRLHGQTPERRPVSLTDRRIGPPWVHETDRLRRNVNVRRPQVRGTARFDHTLVADRGEWSAVPGRVGYQWFRDGQPIDTATGRRLHLGFRDVGARIHVEVAVGRDGFHGAVAASRPTPRVGHRTPVRRVATYQVETRGRVATSLRTFRTQVQETFDDPRGWRGSGVVFRAVRRGGDFSLVLSEAAQVPSFSSACSSWWSCRVGRYVVVNQARWEGASDGWRLVNGSRRDYRHMVVNHETGHWLGEGHAGCPAPNAPAPVMQQQSKGLAGCRPNPWPFPGAAAAPGPGEGALSR
jgi:hypothetical protein